MKYYQITKSPPKIDPQDIYDEKQIKEVELQEGEVIKEVSIKFK